jgi:hypothetical protein
MDKGPDRFSNFLPGPLCKIIGGALCFFCSNAAFVSGAVHRQPFKKIMDSEPPPNQRLIFFSSQAINHLQN